MDATAALIALPNSPPATHAPTMGRIAKLRYTHDAMIDQLLMNPSISQNSLAALFGFSAPWVSNVMASDAFQSKLAARREELVDPTIRLTLEERYKALAMKSCEVVMAKLNMPNVSDNVALKALELGAKASGLGQDKPQAPVAADHLAQLANRLIDLQSGIRKGVTIDVESQAS